MKNALSITLGILLLAAVGFAGTDSREPAPAPDKTVVPELRANDSQITNEAGSTASQLDAKQCKTVAVGNSWEGPDECAQCQLDCMEEWRRCRRNCGLPGEWLSCIEGCVDDLIWCQNTGCAHVCGSSQSNVVGTQR